jgi:hypothetical protein
MSTAGDSAQTQSDSISARINQARDERLYKYWRDRCLESERALAHWTERAFAAERALELELASRAKS